MRRDTRHIGWLLALAALVSAVDSSADEATTLVVIPSICLLAPGEARCSMDVVLRWASPTSRFACLMRLAREQPLRCWQDSNGDEHQDAHESEMTVVYELTGRNNETLAAARVDVLEVQPSDRRRNRRNRHVWDLL